MVFIKDKKKYIFIRNNETNDTILNLVELKFRHIKDSLPVCLASSTSDTGLVVLVLQGQ